ncbi:ABC transporter substrate-binding protein [Falsiroseomonas stagni]|uniref:Iron(III) transport system substrate-binding protein n=1 Tax=Falsiroseomonas stagni DSM 19981 TaxID=1123062 RepID=A0A1I4D8K3_9PROT|nr:ABC transporter substrate-binding protein [Falsiroseomonas stagni]MBX9594945.1 ABC transporter substrate-binding protein [Roseomonas sp.]SFK88486.1 iron(III) transport system substrate-binding protein [Falsiroseomonas stagni DSM 19981]
MTFRLLAVTGAVFALSSPAMAQGSLNMLCAPAADWCEAIAAGFQRDTGIRVAMARKSAGEILAQIRAEAANPRTDIWFGASAETHISAAEGNLLQPYTSPNMAGLHPWAQRVHAMSGERCVGVSSGAIGIAWNRELMARKNLPLPASWADLLNPAYRGEVQLPNPNSSGTAYTIIAGLVQLWDEDRAFDYLRRLHANVNAYTRSGAAPMQAVSRGETALAVSFNMEVTSMQQAGFPIELVFPTEGTSYEVACMSIIRGSRNLAQARRFYDWYLTPAAQNIATTVNQFHTPAHRDAAPDARIADLSRVNLINYDFAAFGQGDMRRRILARWDREIGSLPR